MSERLEYYTTGDDIALWIASTQWLGQSFTPKVDHNLVGFKFKIYRGGSPGIVSVYVYRTDSSKKPTGPILSSGSIDGDSLPLVATWIACEVTPIKLESGVQYAVVLKTEKVAPDLLDWRCDVSSPTYPGGTLVYSTTQGATWGLLSTYDLMFEEWGQVISGNWATVSHRPPTEVLSGIRDYLQVKHDGHLELLATLPKVKADLVALEREDVQALRLQRRRETQEAMAKIVAEFRKSRWPFCQEENGGELKT